MWMARALAQGYVVPRRLGARLPPIVNARVSSRACRWGVNEPNITGLLKIYTHCELQFTTFTRQSLD